MARVEVDDEVAANFVVFVSDFEGFYHLKFLVEHVVDYVAAEYLVVEHQSYLSSIVRKSRLDQCKI